MIITGKQLAQAARDSLPLGIDYKDKDCIGFVRYCMAEAGGEMARFAGVNDLLRRGFQSVVPWEMGVKDGHLQEGALSLIIVPGWNTKYNDSLGSADHVGIVCINPEIIHSSESRGGVFPSGYKNAWTHLAFMNGVEYTLPGSGGGSYQPQEQEQGGMDMGMERLHMVVLPEADRGETVNFRADTNTKGVVLAYIRDGETVMAGDAFQKNGVLWQKARYKGSLGYLMAQFLQDISGEGYVPQDNDNVAPEDYSPPQYVPPGVSPGLMERMALVERKIDFVINEIGSKWGG